MDIVFRDCAEAGRRLAEKLTTYVNRDGMIVLALSRGGVPVGYEVAHALSLPLETIPLCESWACPATKSWRWARLRQVACECSMRRSYGQLPDAGAAIKTATDREGHELERREVEYRDP